MDHPSPRHATIVAVTTADGDRHAAVRRRAATIAGSAGSTVILWALVSTADTDLIADLRDARAWEPAAGRRLAVEAVPA